LLKLGESRTRNLSFTPAPIVAGKKKEAGIGGEVGAAIANPPDVHREGVRASRSGRRLLKQKLRRAKIFRRGAKHRSDSFLIPSSVKES
jgi:hypothetical protein